MDPSALIGVELWNKLEGMRAFHGRHLSIYDRQTIGEQLLAMKKAGQDIERCVRRTLQCGWMHIYGEDDKQQPQRKDDRDD